MSFMIRILFLLILFFSLAEGVSAQQSGNASLGVNLGGAQGLKINERQQSVNLDFRTVEDYRNGVSVNKPGQLEVFSAGRFVVKVSTSGELKGEGAETIPASTIKVAVAVTGGNTNLTGMTTYPVYLSSALQQELIVSPINGTLATSFDVTYQASGLGYMTKADGSYNTTVVYTIEAN
jgi:hypothetical protein